MADTLSEHFLNSATARRNGFKATRWTSVREDSAVRGERSNAVNGTLASVLAQGYKTAVQPNGLPILVYPSGEAVAEYDPLSGQFLRSDKSYDSVVGVRWGCVTPCCTLLEKDQGTDPQLEERRYGALATYIENSLCFESIKQADLRDFRDSIAFTTDCLGFQDDEPYFNTTLSIPISAQSLHEPAVFRAIFPPDDEIERLKALPLARIPAQEHTASDRESIGRVIVSYRHQEYGANRITYDDWVSACPAIRLVMEANGWIKARFWTDARLRYINAKTTADDVPWAQRGLEPYKLGPVVVLNLPRQPSIIDRFWLTIERKAGAHHYGTWLIDDAGDAFFYKLRSNLEIYSRAIVTSVSTSQGVFFPKDRMEVLEGEWNELEIYDVKDAIDLLYEPLTLEAREDFVDEDIDEVVLADKGKTVQWCGDVEALIDPPTLLEVFGSLGNRTDTMELTVLQTTRIVKETRVVVVVLNVSTKDCSEFISKRLYVDAAGEIRARSVPRLVDENHAQELLHRDGVYEIDWRRNPPQWLQKHS